jgi:hypothetical protein
MDVIFRTGLGTQNIGFENHRSFSIEVRAGRNAGTDDGTSWRPLIERSSQYGPARAEGPELAPCDDAVEAAALFLLLLLQDR